MWRLFREASLNGGACRDIVEKHVMCKLNGTDLKFFYEVNGETRKLIKRSTRAGDLKKKFFYWRDVVDIDFGSCVGE